MQGSYDEWVEEQRSYYREQYLRMLESLAAVAQKILTEIDQPVQIDSRDVFSSASIP